MISQDTEVKLADRIWIAVALLHREMPGREAFTRDEIRQKLRQTGLMEGLKPQSVAAHLKEHLVANVPPSSTKYRMLYETHPGYLRLFLPGDKIDPGRESRNPSKNVPRRAELPSEYLPLLDWYEDWSRQSVAKKPSSYEDDPLIRLIGSGRHIWANEHADEYVENLRREDL
jgi:hypothetical protein